MVEYIKRDALWVPKEHNVGVAYAFFNTDASRGQIEDLALKEARRITTRGNSGRLEVALAEVKDMKREQDAEIYDFVQEYSTFPKGGKAVTAGCDYVPLKKLKYVLLAARVGKTDTDAANYLGNVMIDIHSDHERGKPFCASVVYRNPEDGYLDFKRD